MKLSRFFTIGVVLTLTTVACGSDDDGAASSSSDAASAATTSPSDDLAPAASSPVDSLAELYPSDDVSEPTDPATDETVGAADAAGLQLLDTAQGSVLGDAEGFSVYLFVPDGQGDSTCYDECEANWPIIGEVGEVGEGLDESLLGSTERTNGDIQATYNGWPLYAFSGDVSPGDTSGQGIGDVWFLIDATGTAVGG